jgi:hypothetical protein
LDFDSQWNQTHSCIQLVCHEKFQRVGKCPWSWKGLTIMLKRYALLQCSFYQHLLKCLDDTHMDQCAIWVIDSHVIIQWEDRIMVDPQSFSASSQVDIVTKPYPLHFPFWLS